MIIPAWEEQRVERRMWKELGLPGRGYSLTEWRQVLIPSHWYRCDTPIPTLKIDIMDIWIKLPTDNIHLRWAFRTN